MSNFDKHFSLLTGKKPFPWQENLFQLFCSGSIPDAVDIPTGLGKSSTMAVWLLARAEGAPLPRRLVYVVDRRAVVDQATDIANELQERLKEKDLFEVRNNLGLGKDGLAISTLRGKFADNRRWLENPSAPAIIVGTVDMIGSRLLFSGYRVSRKMRAFTAGLLGCDSLVLLDEAHLVPPFEKLLKSISGDTDKFGPTDEFRGLIPSFKTMSLSATLADDSADNRFRLSDADRKHPVVQKRLESEKKLSVIELSDNDDLAKSMAEHAVNLMKEARSDVSATPRIIVYCHRRSDAEKIETELSKAALEMGAKTIKLVGARRVHEREEAARELKNCGLLVNEAEQNKVPVFLIATSAGEVGIDLDADHMVCDLVAWERMVQRLGRVNRLGKGKAKVIVLAEDGSGNKQKDEDKEGSEKDTATAVLNLIHQLPQGRQEGTFLASPGNIAKLDPNEVFNASTPSPLHPSLTRPLLDAWSMTSLEEHTGRPEIDPWLRGWEEEPNNQTSVVWRQHLPVKANGEPMSQPGINNFFSVAAPHVTEILETETDIVASWLLDRAKKTLKNLSQPSEQDTDSDEEKDDDEEEKPQVIRPKFHSDSAVAFILDHGVNQTHRTLLLKDLGDFNSKGLQNQLKGKTVVVDCRLGGLSASGNLDKKEAGVAHALDDNHEQNEFDALAIPFQVRCMANEQLEADTGIGDSWLERARLSYRQDGEGNTLSWLVVYRLPNDLGADNDFSAQRRGKGGFQTLENHEERVRAIARDIATKLSLPEKYVDMLGLAGQVHDEGKRSRRWQLAAGANGNPSQVYAKTDGKNANWHLLSGYRHEFGSLIMAKDKDEIKALDEELCDLALHLISAHHGGSRPGIRHHGCEDLAPSVVETHAHEAGLRFVRLQEKWGPWGLAWWESLLRSADQQASKELDEDGSTPPADGHARRGN